MTDNHYLFFDTETTGLPLDYNAPVSRLANWPRLVQLAWLRCDEDGLALDEGSRLIKPDGFIIPFEAANIHGITTERAMADGLPLAEVLAEFIEALGQVGCIVAHNMSYDLKIMQAELLRNHLTDDLSSKRMICTKEATTEFCALPGKFGYKWPKLSELHNKLFGEDFVGAHDALADIRATAKCFRALKERGIIK